MWTWTKSRSALALIRSFGRPHARWLAGGLLATVGLVLVRLAIPWPMKGVVEALLPIADPTRGNTQTAAFPSDSQIAVLLTAYVLLAVALGLAEMGQRVCMAKFATHTVHDLRAAAMHSLRRRTGAREEPGELVARLIGDAARIKESLKGILVHASQNGLLYVGVGVVFLFISPALSVFFLIGALLAIGNGLVTSSRVAQVFHKQRKKEGTLAVALYRGIEDRQIDIARLDRSSAHKDVRVTKLITRSSLVTHGALATATAAAVWLGIRQFEAGRLSPGNLFLFVTYALMVHNRAVQVGRQLARSGKVLVCVRRIGALLNNDGGAPLVMAPTPAVSRGP